QILGNMSVVAGDDLLTGSLISHHPAMIVFGVKLLRKSRGPYQVNEHHCQLAPLAVGTLSAECRAWSDAWFPQLCLPTLYALRFTLSGLSCPDQHLTIFTHRQPLGLDEFRLERLKVGVVEVKPQL